MQSTTHHILQSLHEQGEACQNDGASSALKAAWLKGVACLRAGSELPPLPWLVHLNLIHCGAVTDEGLREIAGRFPQLRALQLKTPWITDAGMRHLSALSLLERLDLVDCELVEGPGLADLVANHPSLLVSSPAALHVADTPAGLLQMGLGFHSSAMAGKVHAVLCRPADPVPDARTECLSSLAAVS